MERKQERISFTEKWMKIWSVEKKIHFVILTIIISLTFIAIIVSTVFLTNALTKQNRQYASEQLGIMASDCGGNLQQYKALMLAMVLDASIQKYCENEVSKPTDPITENVHRVLQNILNIQSNANFVAVINDKSNKYVYNGNAGITETNFEEVYEKDYKESLKSQDSSNIVFSFSNQYYNGRKYTVTVYFPVFSGEHIGEKNGTIVMNLDDNILTQLQKKRKVPYSQMYLTDMEGNVVSGSADKKIDEKVNYKKWMAGNSGYIQKNGKLINYQKVGKWDYYLIDEIPLFYLYKDCVGVIGILLASMVIVMLIAMIISKKLIEKLYGPMNKIMQKMNAVSQGDLRTRIHDTDMDRDSQKLAQGFNLMMDEIDILIAKIKAEQQQLNQMKLNSLQSQIQPHFLYNTLECIHWQAASEGNCEVSTMVKALAKFYRICLSQGKDIIPLAKELEHIRQYIIIQNMRYGDIIDMEILVPKQYETVLIPKITLQPLVENSIYHGIKVKEGRKGKITIYVEPSEKNFYLVVSDDGEGMKQEEIEQMNETISCFDREMGYGINNVNKRIELMFGDKYGLKFYRNEKSGINVKIRLPGTTEESENV